MKRFVIAIFYASFIAIETRVVIKQAPD